MIHACNRLILPCEVPTLFYRVEYKIDLLYLTITITNSFSLLITIRLPFNMFILPIATVLLLVTKVYGMDGCKQIQTCSGDVCN